MRDTETQPILLDGAMGTELQRRGVHVPSHISSIWSASALLEDPEAVFRIHLDYIVAGADVITTNNYAVTRPLLARRHMEDRFAELTATSLHLAHRAREKSGCSVRIAGSLPPLETSYRPGRVLDDERLRDAYREMVDTIAPHVDVLLCETLSCAREARAAAEAACATQKPVWLSWTLQGNVPDRLPSGETLEEAYRAVADLPIDSFLVNCCGANFATRAVPLLRDLCSTPVGAYANSSDVLPARPDGPTLAPEKLERQRLDAHAYAGAVEAWVRAGATIIGGCCFTRPAHIEELRRRFPRAPSATPATCSRLDDAASGIPRIPARPITDHGHHQTTKSDPPTAPARARQTVRAGGARDAASGPDDVACVSRRPGTPMASWIFATE